MRKQQFQSVILGGGLDLVTPPLRIDPGRIIQAKNFECDLNEGYRLFGGFERFSGEDAPVATDWTFLKCDASDVALDDTVTGATSGATGKAIQAAEQASGADFAVYVTSVTGTFVVGETFTANTGEILSIQVNSVYSLLTDTFNDIRLVKENYLRDQIAVPTGSEDGTLGTWRHLATQIMFRNKTGGATAGMFKATTSGWTAVDLGHIVFFDTAANAALAVVGATVSDGVSDTATIEAAGYNTVGKNDLGYFVLSGFTAGFAIAANMTISASPVGTVTTAGAAIALNPDGRHEFRSHNFTGTVDEYNIYGADGVNPAFEYWPTRDIYVPIYTDLSNKAIDTPTYIGVYQNQVFVGYARSIVRNSGIGEVLNWDAADNTIDLNVGATVTGFDEAPKSLIITTRRTTLALTGVDQGTYILDVASANTGAIEHTMQHIGTTFMFDDRGIIELQRTLNFGNFENSTVSRLIQSKLNELRPLIVASTVSLSKNIYRLFASNGEGVSMTIAQDKISFSLFDLGKNVTCAINAEDETGAERIFFGDDAGFVFEMDQGRSFDGVTRQSWIQTAFHFLGSQTVRKRFHRLFISVLIDGIATAFVSAKYSLGSSDVRSTVSSGTDFSELANLNSAFDVGLFDVMVFDDQSPVSDAYTDLTGTGESVSLTISHNSASDDIFTLQDLTYYYKTRRAQRSAR